MRSSLLLLAVTAALTAACDPAPQAECSKGWSLCDGTCRATLSDEANCGACGQTCAESEACVAGACAPDCRSQLLAPLTDPWGNGWDGNERPAADLAGARAACEAIGGRLPSLSELHRVSATKTGAVGDAYRTSYLRALTPADAGNTMTLRLSDGTTSTLANGTSAPYRCVCPAPPPPAFSGGACQGAPGEECFTFAGEPVLAFDAQDRPKATVAAAIWDCAMSGAQLAPAERLAAAILAGLPNGSTEALHTADQLSASQVARVSWADASWTAAARVTIGAPTTLLPFRCVGPRRGSPSSATALEGGVIAPTTRVVVDGADHSSGETLPFGEALGACVAAGGHVPTGAELASAATQGVSRAESGLLWAGDEVESGKAALFGWTGTAAWPGVTDATTNGIPFVNPTTLAASARATANPYRCLYPAVDTSYTGPAETDCNGGCAVYTSTGGRPGTPARIWIDGSDRAPDTYEGASAFCASLGGRLASARDLVEGIRSGLPGSAGVTPEPVLTGDFSATWAVVGQTCTCTSLCCVLGWCGPTCTNVWGWTPGLWTIPQWSGDANPAYDGSTGLSVALGTTARFRCAWTNEIR